MSPLTELETDARQLRKRNRTSRSADNDQQMTSADTLRAVGAGMPAIANLEEAKEIMAGARKPANSIAGR